jgi:hypothetical protein
MDDVFRYKRRKERWEVNEERTEEAHIRLWQNVNIRCDVLGSNLGQHTAYPHFPQSLWTDLAVLLRIRA